MKRAVRGLVILAVAAALTGCAAHQPPGNAQAAAQQDQPTDSTSPVPPVPQPVPDEVVATVNGDQITMKQLQGPLLEAHGLSILLEIMQLDLAKQEAARQDITVSAQDIQDETDRTLIAFKKASNQDALAKTGAAAADQPTTDPSDDALTPDEREHQLTLLVAGQRITRAEFKLAMERNAIIRKLVTPAALAVLTEQNIHDRFNAVYGEKARVKFISLPDMMTVSEVERQIRSGRTFDDEAGLHAYDSAGRPGSGELPPFSRGDLNYPAEFRMVAFGLKPGQVSDPVQIKGNIYLIKLLELIPPRHARYEDYKDAVKRDLFEQTVQYELKQKLQEMGDLARKTMEIKNPILLSQWNQTLLNADELRARLAAQASHPTTQPADAAGAGAAGAGAAAAGGAGAATAPSH